MVMYINIKNKIGFSLKYIFTCHITPIYKITSWQLALTIVFGSLTKFYYSLRERYDPYYKHLQVSVVVLGFTIITYLPGLNVLACCGLTLFMSIIIIAFRKAYFNFEGYLGLFWLMTIGVSILTDLAITPYFMINYPNIHHIDIFLIHLGTARIIVGILFAKKRKESFFFRIKKRINWVLPYLKKDPLFCLAAFLSFIIFSNLCCWCLDIIPCTDNFFSFYIFILTKVILINSIISLFFLAFTKSSEEWYNIVGMSIWLPVALVPSTLFYYYWVLPELILIRLALVDIMHIRVTKFEQDLYEFKIAILYIVDDIENMLSQLKKRIVLFKL